MRQNIEYTKNKHKHTGKKTTGDKQEYRNYMLPHIILMNVPTISS